MVIKIKLRIFYKGVTSAIFWPEKVNWGGGGGGLIYSWNMTFSDKMQIFLGNGVYHL